MPSRTILARHAISRLLLVADSVVKKWSRLRQVWSLLLKTFAVNKNASWWCSNPVIRCCPAAIHAVALPVRKSACHAWIQNVLRRCLRLRDQTVTKTSFVQFATALPSDKSPQSNSIVVTLCISIVSRRKCRNSGTVLVSFSTIYSALLAKKKLAARPALSSNKLSIRRWHSREESLKWRWKGLSSKICTRRLDWKNQAIPSSTICKGMRSRDFRIICVSNALIPTSEVWKTVRRRKMITKTSKKKIWFVESVLLLRSEEASPTVQNMDQTLLSSNANSAAP